MTPEGKVKAKVSRALTALGPSCYRFMPVQNGMGAPGLDYYICYRGCFFAIETKKDPKAKLTERQLHTRSLIDAAGGKTFVVFDDASLGYALSGMRYHTQCVLAKFD